MTIRICAKKRGPLVVDAGNSPIELVGTEGQIVPRPEGAKLYLCRCGASSNKPLCDGSHNRIAFEPPPEAEAGDAESRS